MFYGKYLGGRTAAGRRSRRLTWRALSAAAVAGCAVVPLAGAATVTWTGTGGTSWGTGSSWNNNSGPGTTDTALFNDTGASTLPGEVTSTLNANRNVGGLTFSNTQGKFHTLNLAGFALTDTGNLNFNVDQGQTTTTAIRNGALTVSGAFANINAGRAVSTSSVGIADLSGLSSLSATVQEIQVGTSTAGGATGTLTLSPSNTISATKITVGGAYGSADANGTLHLGASNTIQANEFVIAENYSGATVDIASGGALSLGTPAQRTLLRIADQNTNTNNVYQGRLLLGSAAVNLNLDSLIVAQKQGGPGNAWGSVLGGSSGTVAIGTAAARGNFYVGNTIVGGSAQGTVDFGNLGTLTAYANDVYIGRAASGAATGTVTLPATSTIDAGNSIVVGEGAGGSGALALGQSTTLLGSELSVGRDYSNGSVTIRSGGTLNLGSSTRRPSVFVAVGNTNTNDQYTGKIDLTGATFNGYVNDLIVGQKDGGPGTAAGTLLGGNAGSINIGPAGNTANFYVGRTLSGGGGFGTVDFGGLSTLTANVNTLGLGIAGSGAAKGTLTLAASNTINANSVVVGSGSGDQTSSLVLGNTNVIATPQLTIAQEYSFGSVTIRSGGSLTLGSAAQRTNVSIATATSTNTLNTYTGLLDLTNATLTGYLGNVVVGQKNPLPGGEQGTFTISNLPGNYVDATSILLGAGAGSTGTLHYGGGTLIAGSIASGGGGTATFDWTGGRLSVGTYGTSTIPFNLSNTGTGTLAPGSTSSAIGTTTVYGNYTQSASAAMHIEIAGNSPGTSNDLVNVTGSAALAGKLNLDVVNNFAPGVGQNYLIASYASRSGTFAFVDPPQLPQGVAFTLEYAPTQLLVHMVAPAAKSWTSTAATGTWATAANWSGGTVPVTNSDVAITNSGAAAQRVTVGASATVYGVTLQGSSPTASEELEVLAGVQLGVSNRVVVGPNSVLSGGGEIIGNVTLNGGSLAAASGSTLRVSSGQLTLSAGSIAGAGTLVAPLANVTGTVTRTGGGVMRFDALTVATGGRLDLTNGKLITAEPVGAAIDGTYGGVQGLVQSGRGDGSWNGSGIVTSSAGASDFTTLGVATAAQAKGISGAATATWGGQIVHAADVLVMYTYGGDANLDGQINIDDYTQIDSSIAAGGAFKGWFNGDFNYDGNVDIDDYTIIDSNIGIQGAPFPTASGISASPAALSGVTAVPEPAAAGLLGLCGALALRRRARARRQRAS